MSKNYCEYDFNGAYKPCKETGACSLNCSWAGGCNLNPKNPQLKPGFAVESKKKFGNGRCCQRSEETEAKKTKSREEYFEKIYKDKQFYC